MRVAVATLVAAIAVPAATAAPPAPVLKPLAQKIVAAGAPGAVVYVRDDAGVRGVAAGKADLKTRAAMKPTLAFRVGSITKTFVATVVLQLVAEEKVSLDDTVERWLPGLVPNGAEITLRMLLNHTSGIANYTETYAFLKAFSANRKRTWAPRELVAFGTSQPPSFAPGTAWSYSNTNYILLGLVVEAATGRSMGEELAGRIFEPLGLPHTSFPQIGTLAEEYAHGYLGNGKKRLDTSGWNPTWAWAAGALVSTADDLARFYGALLRGLVLPPAQLAEMTRIVSSGLDSGYGLGITRIRLSCAEAWGHAGAVPGYTSFVAASRSGTRVAAVLVNETIAGSAEDAAFGRALGTAFCAR